MRKLLLPLFVAGLVVSTPLMSHAADNTFPNEITITETETVNTFNASSKWVGWRRIVDRWFYYTANGSKVYGWQKIDGKWYYFHPELGYMYSGSGYGSYRVIDNKSYFFLPSGALADGWFYKPEYDNEPAFWQYFNQGIECSGWQYISGKWYYFDPDFVLGAAMYNDGWNEIDGVDYYFLPSGAMADGWVLDNSKWYHFNTNGTMQFGWQKIGGYWYYLDPKYGFMYANDNYQINGQVFRFNANGTLFTGWYQESEQWYYFDANGYLSTDWKYINSKWYYFDTDSHEMLSDGWYTINDVDYYFLPSGAMADGWVKENGEWYYYSGGKDYTGWLASGGNWYYIINNQMIYNVPILEFGNLKGPEYAYGFDQNGVMITGWHHFSFEQEDGTMFNEWYYYQPNGLVADGWIKSGNNWYFCVYGQMLHGTTYKTGENEVSRFDDNGVWLGYVK